MKTASTESHWRQVARKVIFQVIEDHVHGPVQCLAEGDVLELRIKLREAYPFGPKKHWPYKCWCEEVRAALGFEVKKAKRKAKVHVRSASDILPSMRAWAIARGIAKQDCEESPARD